MRSTLFLLALIFTGATAFPTEVYTWRDEHGRLHFSDKKPDSKQVKNLPLAETKTVDWQNTPELKPLPKSKPVKGIGYLSKRQKRCEFLDKKIEYYGEKSRNRRNSEKYRQKKREYRWLKQKEC